MKTIRILFAVIAMTTSFVMSAQWSPTKAIFDINEPIMKVFLPKDELNTGRAVVACPGGSYLGHAIGHEGWDWAPFLTDMGLL